MPLVFPNDSVPSVLPNKFLYDFLCSLKCITSPASLIILDLITSRISDDDDDDDNNSNNNNNLPQLGFTRWPSLLLHVNKT